MQLADLWSLLNEGGLTVETQAAGKPALRTLLQLDGDRLTFVHLRTLEPLSPEARSLLAAQHADAVRARSIEVLSDGRRVLPLLRHAALVAFCCGELYSVVTRASWHSMTWEADWMGLLRDQIVWLILLIGRAALPWAVRGVVTGVLHWRYAVTAGQLGEALRQDAQARVPSSEGPA